MSRIETALGKISLEEVRRKKSGLAMFEHPLIVLELNKLRKTLKIQKVRFLNALKAIGGKGTVKQITMALDAEAGDPISDTHIRYMASYLLENNQIKAEILNNVIVYSVGSMTDDEYVEFYKNLLPIMEKKGMAIKPWVKEAIEKKNSGG